MNKRSTSEVLGVPIDVIDWPDAINRLMAWGSARESRYVTICNAHVVVTASREKAYGKIIRQSDMATPDGAPVAWMLRRLGHPFQKRINGPDLTWKLCEAAALSGMPVYFYGGTSATLNALAGKMGSAFPQLKAHFESPPFRALSDQERNEAVQRINDSGSGIVFVGLGCPKQERWMADHKGAIRAVMIGVGAAFDFHAGTVRRAPAWMRENGLEWLHRLCSEPRRLWKRYLITNSLFIVGAIRQLISARHRKHCS